MDQSKASAITERPIPQSVRDVQVFLGFVNFYRCFLQGYSQVPLPLTALTKKNVIFEWTPEADTAFQNLKIASTTASILRFFDPNSKIVVETDASDFAVAGVLSQYGSDNILHPIAFFSRKLDPTEVNYNIHDKELLAIVSCFATCQNYLQGAQHTITVYIDHKNPLYFTTTKALTLRQARWSIFLNSFGFVITYHLGSKNSKADVLSQRSDKVFERGIPQATC
ncbi:hypothetical protein RMATCC62417_13627 [Rhizopus microsporus]|nr:hypothetical protein RMATCC62417_13627 [Rhizopus microsporus]